MSNALGVAFMTRGYAICPVKSVEVVVLPPAEGQNLLVKALEFPLPTSMTEAKGIHQSDIIIRTALTMAIADLRAQPWLLDHIFASLLEDEKTAQTYGEKERQKAKDWFLKTDIPVVMDYYMQETEGTSVSITLVDSVESENTLADIHYQSTEDMEAAWPPLVKAFTPEAYSATTGIMKVPVEVSEALVIAPGMLILDRVGKTHEILEVTDVQTLRIAAGTVADFTDATIRGQKPRLVTQLESLSFKETYRIGCHAHGEPFRLTWLHSIMVFILLRYKEVLLEARGFERSILTSSPFAKNEALGQENMWTRFITVTGYVRQFWPKTPTERVLSQTTKLKISKPGETAQTFVPQDGYDADDAPWMHQDGVGIKIE